MASPEKSADRVSDRAEGDGQRYTARLLIGCADRRGIVAAVSGFLLERGANVVSSNQYSSDPIGGRFFLRTEFFLEGLADGAQGAERERLQEQFDEEVARRFEMDWEIRWWGERQRIAILVSRQDHCLVDLLWRWGRGELDAEVVAVISNHRAVEEETVAAGVDFHHVPVEQGGKERAEAAMLELLAGNAELLVLARYMQILSGELLARLALPVINIHHSFLPAFAGADPYSQARERGVKLIGATAHYVTEELDGGPIIDQDTTRVSHRDSAERLAHIGRDIERVVLARAVRWHLEDRVIINRNATVVFA